VLLEDMPPVEIVEILRRLPHFEECPARLDEPFPETVQTA
jgi:hypothetical protein